MSVAFIMHDPKTGLPTHTFVGEQVGEVMALLKEVMREASMFEAFQKSWDSEKGAGDDAMQR